MAERTITFLQASDLHLGGRAWPGCFSLQGEQAEIRLRELRSSVSRMCRLACEHRVDLVLIPGDLFDSESVPDDLVNMLIGELAALAPCPVFIAPGNHDYLGPGSVYLQETRLARNAPLWPENVHLFTSPDMQTKRLSGHPEVSITATADCRNVLPDNGMLRNTLSVPQEGISFFLFHGSRLAPGVPASIQTNPFTDAELLSQRFSYTALGHYHTFAEIRDEHNRIRAAYGGRPFGAEMAFASPQTGRCLIGVVDKSGICELEGVSLDPRRIVELDVHLDGVTTQDAAQGVLCAALSAAGDLREDLVRVRIQGTHAPGLALSFSIPEGLVFAAALQTEGVRPGYDIQSLLAAASQGGASVESLFVQEIHKRLQMCDKEEKLVLQDALYYGLDALHGMPPEVRHVD